MSLPDPREEALDALITASLHLFDSEPTEEELCLFLEQPPVLPEDKRRALADFKPNFFEEPNSLEKREAASPAASAVEAEELYLAMNRKNSEDARSSETEAELERRRKEALEKLKPRPRPPETP